MYKTVDLLISYFNHLEEESIRDNFVLIYELLDEVMDHGYPQTTETNALKEYIKMESYKMKKKDSKSNNKNLPNNLFPWRKEGIKYRINQAFLDVVESVNSLVINLFIIRFQIKV